MGFTVEQAAAPTLAIRAGKGNRVPVWVDLSALADLPAAERAKAIKDRTGSFSMAFLMIAVVPVLVLLATLVMRPPRLPQDASLPQMATS